MGLFTAHIRQVYKDSTLQVTSKYTRTISRAKSAVLHSPFSFLVCNVEEKIAGEGEGLGHVKPKTGGGGGVSLGGFQHHSELL